MKKSHLNISETSDLENIRKILNVWIKDTTKKNDDVVCLIFGREGVGKSSLALTIAEIINQKRGIDFNLKNNMHFSFRDWKKATVNSKAGTVQIIDEASKFLLSRRAMSAETVNALEFVQECRKFNNIHLVCIPSIKYIDKYFREDRINAAFHVTSKGRVTLYPGYYAVRLADPRTRKEVHARYGSKLKDTYRAYEDYFGAKKWKAYEDYCKSKIKKDDEVPDEYYKHTWLRPVEAQKLASLKRDALNQWAEKGYILARRLPTGHRRFSKESIISYLGIRN